MRSWGRSLVASSADERRGSGPVRLSMAMAAVRTESALCLTRFASARVASKSLLSPSITTRSSRVAFTFPPSVQGEGEQDTDDDRHALYDDLSPLDGSFDVERRHRCLRLGG